MDVVNRTLEMYLRCFTGDKPRIGLSGYLGQNIHTILVIMLVPAKLPSRYVVYGRLPPTLLSHIPGTERVEAVGHELLGRDELLK